MICIVYIFLCYLAFNPNEVWAEGPGIEPEGLTVKQKAYFTVHTENAGNAKLDVKCIGPRKIVTPFISSHLDCSILLG